MYNKQIVDITPLGFQWGTADPFLFCVHHQDFYPAGNAALGPAASLAGRNLGQDFTVKDGWRMYHGTEVPGFPSHPHRGFETVTIVLNGFIDHFDSHGAEGRYGNGDVQWMTAGSGLQHAEMFPLLDSENPNPLELFQIWLNLPRDKKFCKPYYRMLWAEEIPIHRDKDDEGRIATITVIAGKYGEIEALEPAPDSWAHAPENELAIWLVKLEPGCRWIIPDASSGITRRLYFYRGSQIQVSGVKMDAYHAASLLVDEPVTVRNGTEEAHLLLLQGRPISEPVARYGPFVMNTQQEIRQAFEDYQRTEFGGWPWSKPGPVHPGDTKRFSRYADGSIEHPNPNRAESFSRG